MKDKINLSTLNHVTIVSTRSEEKTWVGRASELYFVDWRAYAKTRQTNGLKNVNCILNDMRMWCERGGTPVWCFYGWNVWNVNALNLFLLIMKLYMWKFSRVLVTGESILDSFRMSYLHEPNPISLCMFLVW